MCGVRRPSVCRLIYRVWTLESLKSVFVIARSWIYYRKSVFCTYLCREMHIVGDSNSLRLTIPHHNLNNNQAVGPFTCLSSEMSSTFWKIGRLKTFDHWPFQSPDENTCNPERMAAAGFLAVGGKEEPDLVECFICSKQLDGWDPDDDPWYGS